MKELLFTLLKKYNPAIADDLKKLSLNNIYLSCDTRTVQRSISNNRIKEYVWTISILHKTQLNTDLKTKEIEDLLTEDGLAKYGFHIEDIDTSEMGLNTLAGNNFYVNELNVTYHSE